jgi:hypothetical protein
VVFTSIGLIQSGIFVEGRVGSKDVCSCGKADNLLYHSEGISSQLLAAKINGQQWPEQMDLWRNKKRPGEGLWRMSGVK